MKPTYKFITVQPFGSTVTLIVANNIKTAHKYALKQLKPDLILDESHYSCLGLFVTNLHNGIVYDSIILPKTATMETIIHECFHAYMSIASHRGAQWSEESDEFYAHGISKFTVEVINSFNEIIKNGHKKS